MCVLHPSMRTITIKFQFDNPPPPPPPITGSALIIALWRHDLSCDDTSESWYGEPWRYTKPVAFCFLPEYTRHVIVIFIYYLLRTQFQLAYVAWYFALLIILTFCFRKITLPWSSIYIFLSAFLYIFHTFCTMMYRLKKYLFV